MTQPPTTKTAAAKSIGKTAAELAVLSAFAVPQKHRQEEWDHVVGLMQTAVDKIGRRYTRTATQAFMARLEDISPCYSEAGH